MWHSYERLDFSLNGREVIIVKPLIPSESKPWVWRAEFFDAFAQADQALVEQGFHLAYYKVSDMYGCPEAIDFMHEFQHHVREFFGLAEKAVLFGFSRGGLYAFNYAARYPDYVSALYLDAPVLDIRSWPGGKGDGIGSSFEWLECLKWYGLTEEKAEHFDGNPLDHIPLVVAASIPIILVAGAEDIVVPFSENGAILVDRYRESGGEIQVIIKQGIGHHPHSLEDPRPIVDYIMKYSTVKR